MNRTTLLVLLIGAFGAGGAAAQETAEARGGLTLARQICAGCHAVEKAPAPSPNARAPSFHTIATTPGMSELALYSALRTPHPAMPSLVPDSAHLKSIIAYIRSLAEGE